MPELTDDQRDDLFDDEESSDEGGESNEESADSADGEAPKGDADKRIRDLQSKADAETARANKLEKMLANRDKGGDGNASADPEREALMAELREASLDAVYGEFSELRDFGIDRTLVEGRTRAEMRASATALVALIKSVATKERNRVLRENGIKAEPAGNTRTPPKNYETMSDEDFEKEIARARNGGVGPIW